MEGRKEEKKDEKRIKNKRIGKKLKINYCKNNALNDERERDENKENCQH